MEEAKQVKAAQPIPWQVKWFVILAAIGIGFLYIYNKFIVLERLGPPPIGWHEVAKSLSIEHIKLQPCETRLIRSESMINRISVLPDPFRLMVWMSQTNTTKIDLQVYRLKPDVIADVPLGKPKWIELRQHVSEDGEEAFSDAKLHIHSKYTIDDVAGIILEGNAK